jgi:hypothetical protein
MFGFSKEVPVKLGMIEVKYTERMTGIERKVTRMVRIIREYGDTYFIKWGKVVKVSPPVKINKMNNNEYELPSSIVYPKERVINIEERTYPKWKVFLWDHWDNNFY